MKPAVSVCIPTFNSARLLGEAIRSVLAQDLTDFELLVLDNASTDGTEEVVRSFPDARLRYVRNETNLGFPGNLNKCLEFAQSDRVAFLCADDLWRPGLLGRLAAALDRDDRVVLAHAGHDVIDGSGTVLETRVYPWPTTVDGKEFFSHFLKFNIEGIALSSVIVKRETALVCGGFNEKIGFCPDLELWLRLSAHGLTAYVREPLAAYRVHSSNLTKDFQRRGTSGFQVLDMVDAVFEDPDVQRTVGTDLKPAFVDKVLRRSVLALPLLRASTFSRSEVHAMFRGYAKRHPALRLWPTAWLAYAVSSSRMLSRLAYGVGRRAGWVSALRDA